ncbi:hypothetical protein MMC21_001267 [Puttea exsequens]|nr:hypothetical protein [Puttea exsequens]
MASTKSHTLAKDPGQKRSHEDTDTTQSQSIDHEQQQPKSKQAKTVSDTSRTSRSKGKKIDKSKLEAIMDAYGALPLQDSQLGEAKNPTPEAILAMVFLALLTSARISHELAYKSVKCLIDAGYHDINKLKASSWEERTEVLTKGGYTRYREKTATGLGELANLIEEKYGKDLNNLLKQADGSLKKIRSLVQEIKGIGKVGVDIFCNSVQGIWPQLAPFVDPRSMETAKAVGLGSDVGAMWEAVGKDPVEMCKLASALTMIRLGKVEGDFK